VQLKVVVREAVPSDKEPLMSFIKENWGGHDYIPSVWDAWLKERNALMFVVDVNGTAVGMSRIRFLADGTAWLEGARVHPDLRGRGFATALGEKCVNVASKRGIRVLRLTSSSRNRKAHRQIARIGFKEVARFSTYMPGKKMQLQLQKRVRIARLDELRDLFSTITSSPEYHLGARVMWDGFAATSLTEGVLKESIARRQVYSAEGAVAIARLGGEGSEVWSQICFLAGNGSGAVRLVKHVFAKQERTRITWRLAYLPQGSGLIGEVRRAGMTRDFSHILFEKVLAKG
jgi:GNAT superfamily N-acetyltransferase